MTAAERMTEERARLSRVLDAMDVLAKDADTLATTMAARGWAVPEAVIDLEEISIEVEWPYPLGTLAVSIREVRVLTADEREARRVIGLADEPDRVPYRVFLNYKRSEDKKTLDEVVATLEAWRAACEIVAPTMLPTPPLPML